MSRKHRRHSKTQTWGAGLTILDDTFLCPVLQNSADWCNILRTQHDQDASVAGRGVVMCILRLLGGASWLFHNLLAHGSYQGYTQDTHTHLDFRRGDLGRPCGHRRNTRSQTLYPPKRRLTPHAKYARTNHARKKDLQYRSGLYSSLPSVHRAQALATTMPDFMPQSTLAAGRAWRCLFFSRICAPAHTHVHTHDIVNAPTGCNAPGC